MGGSRIAGYKNSLTTVRSKVLQRTGVMEIGLKSAWLRGEGILGAGRIEAFFHWRRNLGKIQTGSPQRRRQMQVEYRLNADAVAENWRLSTRSVVNLARSQVYHTERPPYLFTAQRQLILVISQCRH